VFGYDVMAPGFLLFGPASTMPLNLGVPRCDFFINPSSFTPLMTIAAPGNWTLPVPLPGAPLLTGVEMAMQAIYGPTVGPLGVDVTNGLRLRLGW
jgi:hypothetical protein